MAVLCYLSALAIIEKDKNNDTLWTWSYPHVTVEQREFLMSKNVLNSDNPLSVNFLYLQWKQTWYYIYIVNTDSDSDSALSEVSQFALVILSKDFNPEKYSTLGQLFSQKYRTSGSPVSMLNTFLSVITHGMCSGEGDNGKFTVTDFDSQKAYARSCIKDIIQTFGVESIYLYTAMMLKKRIVLYLPPHSLGQLLDYTRSIPALAWHRQDWSVVHPWVALTSPDLDDLLTLSHYVMGCTEADVESRLELYDIFVNVPSSQITVAPHAKETFAMGKLHKDIATLMMQKTEDQGLTDADVIREITAKTNDLLTNLKSLAPEGHDGTRSLTLEHLKKRKMPQATENFLFSLAACEGMVEL